MGLDLDVYMLVGVYYEDVVEDEYKVVEVLTKYNENTGNPYEYKKTKKVWKIDDTEFSEEWLAYTAIEKVGLTVYEERGEPVFVGVTLDHHKGERIASGLGDPILPNGIVESVEEVKQKLSQLGIKYADVRVYTFSSVSF